MQENSPDVLPTVTSSPQASMPPVRKTFATKYPWRTMSVGTSFIVPYEYTEDGMPKNKMVTLVPYANRMSKKLGRKFRVINHGQNVGYEVARIS